VNERKYDEGKRAPQVVEALGEFVWQWRSLGNMVIIRPTVASFDLMMVRSPLSSLKNETRFECLARTAVPLNSHSKEAVSRQSCRLAWAGRLVKKLSFQPLAETGTSQQVAQPLLCEALNADEELLSLLRKAGLESVSIAGYEGPLAEMSLALSADADSRTQRPAELPSITWLISASKKIQPEKGFHEEVHAIYRALDSLSYRLKDLTQKVVL